MCVCSSQLLRHTPRVCSLQAYNTKATVNSSISAEAVCTYFPTSTGYGASIGAYPTATAANYTQTLSLKATGSSVAAACPAGTLLSGCQCLSPSGSCMGAVGQGGRCVATLANATGVTAYAQAICASFEGIVSTFLVDSSRANGSNVASCPGGSVLLDCDCSSQWVLWRSGSRVLHALCSLYSHPLGHGTGTRPDF